MKWLTNLNPEEEGSNEYYRIYESCNLVEGKPKATEKFTVKQLEKMGFLGLYDLSAEEYS